MSKMIFPRLVYNWISTAGVFLAVMSGLLMLILLAISFFQKDTNPYFGIFLYMVLPPFLLGGLLLIPVGMYRQWRRWQRTGEMTVLKWPYIDLNKKSHRNATMIFFFGTIIFLAMGAVGSYEAYHYSESVDFCGRTCHTVMKPEYTAYQNSSHARVRCTACHVGPGAGWYAKSKLSGAYQIYAVTANIYPRPIPTPIKNLRPAQETCEQCHWPSKFYGGQQRQFNNYMYDEPNTPWPINMLIKTGGGDPRTGQTAGIHWHMNIGVRVEYIARDDRRQDIPWIKITDRQTGEYTVYQDAEKPLPEETLKTAAPRTMDCMDCHNRPSHIYNSPDYAINLDILTGRIDGSMPEIKRVAVEAMAGEYNTEQQARQSIADSVEAFYKNKHPDIYRNRRVLIDSAIAAIQESFSQNIFPEMRVSWLEYPNNIGHFLTPGCMRCHDGKHSDIEGTIITRDCRACHTILSQGSGNRAGLAYTQEGLEFVHPDESVGDAWHDVECYDCHTGTRP
jgi:transposase